jgi:arylsulfatase A-like enzyme
MRFKILFITLFCYYSNFGQKPNVIVIITDDQGYGDFSFNDNPFIKTPNIDALAAKSVNFIDFHVAPMCTPTRGQLMSGLDAFRNHAINVSSGRTLLDPKLKTMANYYKDAGYKTALFGKWHLGDNHPYRPMDRGFDQSLWFGSSHINSVPDFWNNDYFDDTYLENNKKKKVQGYCTDVFFKESISWISKQKDPFFLYLAPNASHWPHFVPEIYRERIREQLKGKEEKLASLTEEQKKELISFLAMGENIDENIGNLENELKRLGKWENTILVFLTDNGSTMGHLYYNAGMKGNKTTLWEGGHRVPLIVSWPKKIVAFKNNQLSHVQDLLPSLLDLCEIKVPSGLDGISLKNQILSKDKTLVERKLVINYSRMPGMKVNYSDQPMKPQKNGAAVLWGPWRLLENKSLYNVKDDLGQNIELSSQNPEIVELMQSHLDAWWKGLSADVEKVMPVNLGHSTENPALLTACEWLDVFVDQQKQIRLGEQKNGVLNLNVLRAGKYKFTLSRWPLESGLKLSQGLDATAVKDGMFMPGKALNIKYAGIQFNDKKTELKENFNQKAISFVEELKTGPLNLKSTFYDSSKNEICGAYYVYVHYLGK